MAGYAVLHGAKENCGDYLIRDAAIELINTHLQVNKDDIYKVDVVRNELPVSDLEELSRTEVAFLAGGPGYREDFYPGVFPSLLDILDVTTVVPLGPGWKGLREDKYTFTDSSLDALNRLINQPEVPYLGARDLPTVRVLQRHGIPAKLTGCPAWYYFGGNPPKPKFDSSDQIHHIVVSTPSQFDARHLLQYLYLLHRIQTEFPVAEISCIFHRGKQTQGFTPFFGYPWKTNTWKKNSASALYGIINLYSRFNGIELYDASGSSEYTQRYFDADLHVGYRVHAHIPSLSSGTPSFLLQVDGRGLGVSESLGTDADVWSRDGIRGPVDHLFQNLESNITNGFLDFQNINENIMFGYNNMSDLIERVTT